MNFENLITTGNDYKETYKYEGLEKFTWISLTLKLSIAYTKPSPNINWIKFVS